MSQPVLALGAALLTVSGGVWYVPALADLRAGTDRPLSRRTAATACLSGWSTAGIIAALLMVSEAWWIPCAAAVAGTAVTVGFRIRAAAQHRREAREAARHWAQLGRSAAPGARPLPKRRRPARRLRTGHRRGHCDTPADHRPWERPGLADGRRSRRTRRPVPRDRGHVHTDGPSPYRTGGPRAALTLGSARVRAVPTRVRASTPRSTRPRSMTWAFVMESG